MPSSSLLPAFEPTGSKGSLSGEETSSDCESNMSVVQSRVSKALDNLKLLEQQSNSPYPSNKSSTPEASPSNQQPSNLPRSQVLPAAGKSVEAGVIDSSSPREISSIMAMSPYGALAPPNVTSVRAATNANQSAFAANRAVSHGIPFPHSSRAPSHAAGLTSVQRAVSLIEANIQNNTTEYYKPPSLRRKPGVRSLSTSNIEHPSIKCD